MRHTIQQRKLGIVQHDQFVLDAQQLVLPALQRPGLDARRLRVQPLSLINNATLKVDVTRSDAPVQSFVLRVHRPDETTEAAIHAELLWLLAIRQHTPLRVPRPRQTLAGALAGNLRHPHSQQSCWYVLFEWLDGQFLPTKAQTADHAWQVGRFTAGLHQQSQTYAPTAAHARRMMNADTIFDWDALRAVHSQYALITGGQFALFEQAQQRVRDVFDQIGRLPANFGLIHADLIWKNYLFTDQGVGAIDFESCAWGYYLYDLAPTLLGYGDEPHAAKLHTALIAGYRSLRALSSEQEQQLPLLVAARHIVSCCWLAKRLTSPDLRQRAAQIVAHRAAEVHRLLHS